MTIGEKISFRRKQLGLTLEDVGKYVGVAKSTVRKWETGFIENMRLDKVERLAAALDTTAAYLMSTEDVYEYGNIEPLPDMRQVPLIGSIACGTPIYAAENIEGFVEVDKHIIEGFVEVDKHINADFAVRCKGDSMINARIFDGDVVFIKAQVDVENGEIAAVLIGEDATLKRIYKYNNRIELRPENPTFPVLNYEGYELEEIRIIGKAVAFLSGVR